MAEINDIYEEFYRLADGSAAFSAYCEGTFGIDLTQDGFADKAQLDYLADALELGLADRCLDIGCGNGRIADYLSRRGGARVDGMDYSPAAVACAQALAAGNGRLGFAVGDINTLAIPKDHYTTIYLIDTIYFSDDYEQTLDTLYAAVAPGGRIGLWYSEFVFEREKQTRKIEMDETRVARIFAERGWSWKGADFTDAHFALMKRKRRVSERLRPDFAREGKLRLYEKVHEESEPEDKSMAEFEKFTNRYWYRIDKAHERR